MHWHTSNSPPPPPPPSSLLLAALKYIIILNGVIGLIYVHSLKAFKNVMSVLYFLGLHGNAFLGAEHKCTLTSEAGTVNTLRNQSITCCNSL